MGNSYLQKHPENKQKLYRVDFFRSHLTGRVVYDMTEFIETILGYFRFKVVSFKVFFLSVGFLG